MRMMPAMRIMTTMTRAEWSLLILAVAALILTTTVVTGACINTWKCWRAPNNMITLDGDLSDWSKVKGIVTELRVILATTYQDGDATLKCLYDDTNIYFAVEIPGLYRFNATDYHQCPSIATMTKLGADATYYGMGDCPDASSGCNDGVVPSSCDTSRVDIGAYWKLNATVPNVEYSWGGGGGGAAAAGFPPGNWYAVSPTCRVEDDDGDNAVSAWRGAWAHSDPEPGAAGEYTFELARALLTTSTTTDAQYAPGNVYQIGVAFWDPYETDTGFTDAGHYVTGCQEGWIDMELVADHASNSTGGAGHAATGDGGNGGNNNASAAYSLTLHAFAALSGLASYALSCY